MIKSLFITIDSYFLKIFFVFSLIFLRLAKCILLAFAKNSFKIRLPFYVTVLPNYSFIKYNWNWEVFVLFAHHSKHLPEKQKKISNSEHFALNILNSQPLRPKVAWSIWDEFRFLKNFFYHLMHVLDGLEVTW